MPRLRVQALESRETPAQLVSAAGWVYADSGAFQPFAGYEGVLDVSLAGDINGNGYQDIVIGGGAGGGPRVTIVDSQTREEIVNLFAFEPSFRGGVTVAVDGRSQELLVGAGSGGAPVVVSYDLKSFREIRRAFFGPTNYRGGIEVDADAITNDALPALTMGSGKFPIYLNLKGLRGFEASYLANEVYQMYAPLSDLVSIVTTEPVGYPSDYLTASYADLSYFPVKVTGLATDTLRGRQPSSHHRLEVFVDMNTSVNYAAMIFAHEIGHFFGLSHSDDPANVMYAPTTVGSTFSDAQYTTMRANLEKWS